MTRSSLRGRESRRSPDQGPEIAGLGRRRKRFGGRNLEGAAILARVIPGDAEVQVSEQLAKASQVYSDNPVALHLRGMNMLFEAMREKGSMVVVPSSAIETMRLGGTLATTAVARE